MKKYLLSESLPKKSVIAASALLFAAGAICFILSFKYNNVTSLLPLDEISGAMMITGLLLFGTKLKKPDAAPTNDTSNDTIEKCQNILSQINEYIYGDEDEGKEEISITSEKLGKFIYRRKPEWYESQCSWCGKIIKVTLRTAEGEEPEIWLKKTESIFDMQKTTDSRMRKLTKEVLDTLKQENKCPDALCDTKSADFAKRLIPYDMDITPPEGCVIYYYDDINKSDCQVTGYISQDGTLERVEIEDIPN